MSASVALGRAGGEAAGSGLVSFCNKSELSIQSDPVGSRLKKLVRGVVQSAKAIDDGLREAGYSQWYQKSSRWSYAPEHEFRSALLTLTYRPDVEWSPLHIAALLDHYRKWAKRRKVLFSYVWVAELHKSGRIHFHVVFWVTGGETPPFPDAQGWWPHGASNAKWAVSPVGYIAKYASKTPTKAGAFPAGMRLWGAGGLTPPMRLQRSYACAPKWLRTLFSAPVHVVKKVIEVTDTLRNGEKSVARVSAWVEKASGLALFSPWESQGFEGGGLVLKNRGYIEVLSPDGDAFRVPYSMEV